MFYYVWDEVGVSKWWFVSFIRGINNFTLSQHLSRYRVTFSCTEWERFFNALSNYLFLVVISEEVSTVLANIPISR